MAFKVKFCIFEIYLSLVTSNFRNNALSTFPSEMGGLSRLGTLDLQSNQVARFSFQLCSINTMNLSKTSN